MYRRVLVLLGASVLPLLTGTATAQEAEPPPGDVVSVAHLLSNREVFGVEGAAVRVTVEGELVGDYGYRSSGVVWTQLNDDPYARTPLVDGGALAGSNVGIGVRIPQRLLEGADPPGGYRLKGPLVRVTGDWRYHDPGRGGESFLDVLALEVIEPGRVIRDDPHLEVLVAGLVVLGLSLIPALRVRAARKGA
jgi:hypothetical protein